MLACNTDQAGPGSDTAGDATTTEAATTGPEATTVASTTGAEAGSTSPTGDDGDDSSSGGASTTGADTGNVTIECPYVNLQDYDQDGVAANYLNTQEDVEMLAGCTHISDGLDLSGSDIVDLTPLASLRHIGGKLSIYGYSNSPMHPSGPPSLAGLESLEYVQGLELEALRVTDLAPLAGLTDIPGDVRISRNWALTTLEGLHNLASVGGALVVDECESLQDLNGLRGLQRAGVRVWFGKLPITSLHGLEALTEVGTVGGESRVGLYVLSGLTTLDGLAIDWRPEHDVWIYGTKISDLGTFADVDELTALNIDGNPMLTTLGGLESLAVVHDELYLGFNKNLTDLGALESLETVGTLTIDDSAFTDFGPLPALEQPVHLRLGHNQQLTSLSRLAGVTTLPSLVLEYNPKLAALPELSALAQVDGDLELRENAALTALTDLAAVTSVGGRLAVTYHPELLQTDAEAWAAPIAVGGVRKIVGNKGYDESPLDPCPWADDGECDKVCVDDGADCLSD